MKNAPETIYLQWRSDSGEPLERPEWTWTDEQPVHGDDIPYVYAPNAHAVSTRLERTLGDIAIERRRQDLTWGEMYERIDEPSLFWLAVLAEEVGEVALEFTGLAHFDAPSNAREMTAEEARKRQDIVTGIWAWFMNFMSASLGAEGALEAFAQIDDTGCPSLEELAQRLNRQGEIVRWADRSERLRDELIQVAAVAAAIAELLDIVDKRQEIPTPDEEPTEITDFPTSRITPEYMESIQGLDDEGDANDDG